MKRKNYAQLSTTVHDETKSPGQRGGTERNNTELPEGQKNGC